VSFIQGPPGTGKTKNVTIQILNNAVYEQGHIIVVAPSNEAYDNIAQTLADMNRRMHLNRNILRVYARSREFSGNFILF